MNDYRREALIIANSSFQDASLRELISPTGDAEKLASVLRNAEICDFDNVNVLIDETEQNIRRAIARFFKDKGTNDLLFLYISSHGARDENGDLYFAVIDTDMTILRGTAVAADYVRKEMNNSNSRRQVLVLDCCYSGAFAGSKASIGDSVGTKRVFDVSGYGRVVLTATDSTQFAWEGHELKGKKYTSIFSKYLVEGLETGICDQNRDGLIDIDEWYQYAYKNVVRENKHQTPIMLMDKGQGTFIFARNPFGVRYPKEFGQPGFVGLHKVRLQVGGVVAIPKDLRFPSNSGYLTQGFDRCLMYMTEDYFRSIMGSIDAVALSDPNARLLRRMILATAYPIELDKRARLRIPASLREFAGLKEGDEFSVLGQGDYVELWSEKAFDNIYKLNIADYDNKTLAGVLKLLRELVTKPRLL